jgi:hypothetical protein
MVLGDRLPTVLVDGADFRLNSAERFCEGRYRSQHVKPDKRDCPFWYAPFHSFGV